MQDTQDLSPKTLPMDETSDTRKAWTTPQLRILPVPNTKSGVMPKPKETTFYKKS